MEASRAPFWSGAVISHSILWNLLSPCLATRDAVFFYHLGATVVALGAIVGGLAALFLPSIGLRAQLATVATAGFALVFHHAPIPLPVVLTGALVIALASLCCAKPVCVY